MIKLNVGIALLMVSIFIQYLLIKLLICSKSRKKYDSLYVFTSFRFFLRLHGSIAVIIIFAIQMNLGW